MRHASRGPHTGPLFLPCVGRNPEYPAKPQGAAATSAVASDLAAPRSPRASLPRRRSPPHPRAAPLPAAASASAQRRVRPEILSFAICQPEMAQNQVATAPATSAGEGATPMPGINAELLVSMMECVDTSLFSSQQLANWEQMKVRVKTAAATNTPVAMTGSDLNMVKTELAKTNLDAAEARITTNSASGEANVDFRSPLHREASIQDVLACLLDQQPPSSRVMNSSGGSFLLSSEVKNRASAGGGDDAAAAGAKPTLKSLLSSNDFTMTEKKESLRHLLSFIDNSFASNTPEPLTQVYKDAENGNLQRLSSLQLMRSFMMNPGASSAAVGGAAGQSNMGMRTTSFEIIQAMLNATSNQAIQKPMTSQDSFRFQHLAKTLESIETDVAYDNEDYGGEDVVQVDNLDNLLDYHGGSTSSAVSTSAAPTSQSASLPPAQGGNSSLGFVDTQTLLNPSRSIYSEINNGNMTPSGPGYQTYGQVLDQNPMHGMYPNSSMGAASSSLPPVDMMGQGMTFQGMDQVKMDPMQTQQQLLQQQLMRQEQQHKQQQQQQQQQYSQMYQSALMQQNMMINPSGFAMNNGQFTSMMLPPAMLPQKPSQQQHTMRTGQNKQQPQLKPDGSVQICSALGCNHPARVKGMCKLHGGGRRCKVEGCMKSAQTGHLCIAHGGGKPCNVEGCPKTAQSRGLCKQHGGGVRCKFEGCTKSCQSGGFCRGHGGGKRCEYPNCTKWAQKNGHCAKHAQEIAQQLQQQQAQLVHP